MSWSIGHDGRWNRDIGYGVPAYCDHPGCSEEIDRGLACVCGGQPYGEGVGCGLYFCGEHRTADARQLCERCEQQQPPFEAKPDHPRWLAHKLTHESWQPWRAENPEAVRQLTARLEEVSVI